MSFCIDSKKFIITFICTLIILTGTVVRDGGVQEQGDFGVYAYHIGTLLYSIGLLGLAYIISQGKTGLAKYIPIIACIILGIVVATIAPIWIKYGYRLPPYAMILLVLYAISWILIGWSVSIDKTSLTSFNFGLGASACVLLAMLVFQPWQQDKCIVDGPGMALYAIGMVSLSVANSV